jgi:hypothetical protein
MWPAWKQPMPPNSPIIAAWVADGLGVPGLRAPRPVRRRSGYDSNGRFQAAWNGKS